MKKKNLRCGEQCRSDNKNVTGVKNLKETTYTVFNKRESDETKYKELKNVFGITGCYKSLDGRFVRKKPIDSKNKVVDKEKMISESDYNKKINYSDVLAMRPFPFTDLYNKVPKPKVATIKNGLPFWNNGSLDSKLYIIPYPEGLFVCSRGKIGEKLWKSCDEGDFVFYDIYGYEVSIPYDPVHDEHLKKFFSNPNNVQTLKKLGMVTDKLDARCTLKEYNLYRKYLYKIHAEALNKKLTSKVTRDLEETSVKIAIENTKKEVRKLLKSELVSKRQKIAMAKSEAEQLKKRIKCQGRMLRVQEVQKNNEKRKHDAIMKAEQRHIEFKNRIQQRVTAGAEIEHKRKIDALLQRQMADLQKKMHDEEVRKKRQSDRENRIKERWEKKRKVQNLAIARDNTIRNERAEELKSRAKKRLRTNMLQLKHRKEKLEELKVELIKEKERKRRETIRKNAQYEETIHVKEGTRKVPKTIMKIVERFKKSQGITEFVQHESSPFEKKVYNEVKEVIIYLMDTSIKSYILKLVKKNIHHLITSCIEFYDKQLLHLNNLNNVLNTTKRCSIQEEILRAHGEIIKQQPLDYEQRYTTQIVSFGSVITIDDDNSGSNKKKFVVRRLLDNEPLNEMLDEAFSKCTEGVENEIKKQEKTIIKKQKIETPLKDWELPLKTEIYSTLKYLCACVLGILKIQISNFLLQYGNVTPLLDIKNLDMKEMSVVDYITASFIYVIESKKDVDDDECVEEVVKFIALQILSITL